ncbi:Multidrug resistance protein NorM [Rubripirellula amarantea]|uniref:Multidrug resistance protein NorM n=1 Tax=Rubripirellula amarantea TaxID=2527999 RepID=A0A5C5WXV4_9BACT|nr:MATE family efflux transporter [Rubripirellula amarantea]TWT54833.1 Multidrug resistance protein NorM [Rubripirellula amarantea]
MTLTSPSDDRVTFGYRAMLNVALPLTATVGCFAITLFTDRTLLMWYQPVSSAASIAAGNLYWATVCIPVTAMGFITPLVAIAMGPKRRRGIANQRVWSLLWQSIWITLFCVPIFAVIGLLSGSIFTAVGHAPELAAEEATYFRTLLLVAPASMLEAGLTAFFIGRRITSPILRANIASAVLNVVLDVWIIFGGLGVPAMGVLGAALATAVSMWFKVGVFAVLLVRLRSFGRYRLSAWRPSKRLMSEIMVPGSALGIQQLIRSLLFSFVLMAIGAASVNGLAATSAALSLYQLLSIPAIGLATAVTVITGQAYAKSGMELAKHVIFRSLFLGLSFALILSGLLVVFPQALLAISLGGVDDMQRAEIEPLAARLLGFAAVYCLVDVSGLILAASAKSIGRTSLILVATAIPGFTCVAVGWFSSPSTDAAVTHWWTVLIGWATLQVIGIAWGIRHTLVDQSRAIRPQEKAASTST